MKIVKCCLKFSILIMTLVIEDNTLYQQKDVNESSFLMSHMSLYLRYQGNYRQQWTQRDLQF